MGHSNTTITSKTYFHNDKTLNQNAIQRITDLIWTICELFAKMPVDYHQSTFVKVQEIEKTAENLTFSTVMVHLEGLEPAAHWLRVSCSTNWAKGAFC